MKTKKVTGLTALVLAFMGFAGLGSIGKTKRGCEIYQGWTRGAEGETIYVFDPKKIYERPGFPRYSLTEGNLDLRDSLVIGERYCLEYKDPLAPWASREIVGMPQLTNETREKER